VGSKWERPSVLEGKTVRVVSELGRLYITVNTDGDGRVREVFIHLGKAGTHISSLVEALGRVISVALQYGVPVDVIIEQLRGIKSGMGLRQEGGGVVFSVPDGVGYGLELVLGRGSGGQCKVGSDEVDVGDKGVDVRGRVVDLCPECGGGLVKVGNCHSCLDCGYSTCF